MNKSDFESEFKCPGNEYRSIPFWAWNDKLDKEEIKRQIRSMKVCGIGGFFIHSRDGLETEYLGDEWIECIRTAVDEAKANGMYVWLYDEDRWPSGSCGGTITKAKDNSCKGLTLEVCREIPISIDGDVLAVYTAVLDGMNIRSLKRVDIKEIRLNNDEVLLIARLEISGGSEWFNYSPPPDNLNPETVREFIRSTHEVYRREFGFEFGKVITGIFTDEPSLADRHAAFNPNRGWIPWTYGFAEYFKKMYGRNALDTIPYLYFDGEESTKIRHDYWQAIAKRFKEVYTNQISEWCRQNNLLFTGHFLQEDKLGLSCRVNGSVMPHYIAEDVPAIDLLTERCDEYLTVKQCVSVSSQMGMNTVLAETYGCTGWDFSFEGQKWIGDWLYVLGVNQRCQHLALYSLRGCRKRDYPPSINYNNSWWKQYKTVEDYFARLGYMLRRGRAVRQILVIHPMSTVWSKVGCNPYGNPKRSEERDIPPMNTLGDRYNTLVKNLCRKHYDCDLGDEIIISEYGGNRDLEFRVGECTYDTVIVPFCENMLSSTFERLLDYAECGGTVIGIKPLAEYIDGKPSDKVLELLRHRNFVSLDSEEKLYDYLQNHKERTVSIINSAGNREEDVLYQLRRDDSGYILYVVNNNREDSKSVRICLNISASDASVYRMDLLSGEIVRAESVVNDGKICFYDCLPGCGSSLFFITDSEIVCGFGKDRLSTAKIGKDIKLKLVGYKNDTKNVLTLDMCKFVLDGDKSDNMEIWRAQCEIRKRLGMRQINKNGLEQRYRWISNPHPNDGAEVELELEFIAQTEVSDAMLVLERPECFEIRLDGEIIDGTPNGYFLDRAFKTISLPDIGRGRHSIILRCGYRNDMELENCYIIGEFGVNNNRELIEKPKSISFGNIGNQGYLHYIGGIDYIFSCNFQGAARAYLDARGFKGACASALINDSSVPIPWKADGVIEVTDYLKQGNNKIVIKVIGSPRNMLGPLHITNKPMVINDSCFCPTGDNYTSDYVTSEVGLFEKPRLTCFESRECDE